MSDLPAQKQHDIAQLLLELDQLLLDNMFSALSCCKVLQQLLVHSEFAEQLLILAELVSSMHFEQARDYLRELAIAEKLGTDVKHHE